MTGRSTSVKIAFLALVGVVSAAFCADLALACWGNPYLKPEPTPSIPALSPAEMTSFGAGTYRVSIAPGSTFPPSNPGSSTCACGLAVGPGLTVTGVQVLDMGGNPVAGFTGFAADPQTTTELNTAFPAPGGKTWFGFSSPVTTIPSGVMSSLVFTVAATGAGAGQQNVSMVSPGIIGGRVASAQADLTGANFDAGHRGAALVAAVVNTEVPTLSQWGMILLVSMILLGGTLLIARRRRAGAAV